MSCNIKDVARAAGVSVGTVSRVINGYGTVSPDRREAVHEAMDRLGYRKNSTAALLAARRGDSQLRTGNIGLWMAEMGREWSSNTLYANYLNAIEESCAARGCHLILEHAAPGGGIPRCVAEGKVDGLIVKAIHPDIPLLTSLAGQLPVIGLSMYEPELALPQVSTDNRAAGELVCRYLRERGHRRIAFISLSASHRMFEARRQGYESFMRRCNAFDPELVCTGSSADHREPQQNFEDMRQPLAQLMALDNPPTAVITANDWMAAGLYEAMAERGLHPGKDLSVVGFDHVRELCRLLRPHLTSYETPMSGMGKAATDWLLDLLESGSPLPAGEVRLVSGKLMEYDSVSDIQ